MGVVREGLQAVPGALLRFRLVGDKRTDAPVLVFENGWGASFHMWSWVQRELQDHAQLLFYCRAGIGGSILHQPQTVPGFSAQLAALLDGLKLRQPAVIVGQSYGGLLASAHAVQIPDRVAALVQVDPAVERPDPVIDASQRLVAPMTTYLILLATLGLPDPILSPSVTGLPEADAAELRRSSFRSAASLRAARRELALIPPLQEIARRPAPQPRLVLSATKTAEPAGAVMRRLAPAERARSTVEHMQADHRLTAQRGTGSRWERLPHSHGGLVFTREGARDTAAGIVDFVRGLKDV